MTAAGWIRTADQLPELGAFVLGWCEGALAVFCRDDLGEDGWIWARQLNAWNLADPDGAECEDDYIVTHWMPIPAPPPVDEPEAPEHD
jgi:hypothetical protein